MSMARKKTNLTLSEQIVDLENEIEKGEKALKDLKAKKKALLEKKKQEDLEEIYRMMKESGTSVDDLKEILSK